MRIRPGDEFKAAFITSRGLFEPTVMFFGMTNSPATFQRMVDDIFVSGSPSISLASEGPKGGGKENERG